MRTFRRNTDHTELRREPRYFGPQIEVRIGNGEYRAINWSMGGLLLDGICHDIGTRVRGTFGVAGSRDGMPFAATVVRIEPEFGNCAICFDDPRIAQIEHAEAGENPFFEQRLH
ncbi:MAG TPA: PilZ domain-containing protein [Stellaceae bacterium]|nr:PilZ domain-containing protein [Stellaceae bacterium]